MIRIYTDQTDKSKWDEITYILTIKLNDIENYNKNVHGHTYNKFM